MVATPQIGFAQEVVASAPPPYSEYAPPPQVKGINSMHMTKRLHNNKQSWTLLPSTGVLMEVY